MTRYILIFLAGALGALGASEVVLRLVPVSTSTATSYYLDPLIITYPPRHEWTASTGWDLRNASRNRSNNDGFLAHRDFVLNRQAVALIGDSYIEAVMLSASDRPGQQLERALGGRPVYAMGGPGSSLLDYAERIRLAQERYGVRDFVLFLERGDIVQSLCGSGNSHGPCLDRQTLLPRTERLPPPSALKRFLRQFALAQYIVGQLKFEPKRFWRQAIEQSRPTTPHRSASPHVGPARSVDAAESFRSHDAVVSAFLSRINNKIEGRLVIVLDSNRNALNLGHPELDPARVRLLDKLQAMGIAVVDTEPIFRAYLKRSSRRLEVGPYDGHLNAVGVKLAMEEAALALGR